MTTALYYYSGGSASGTWRRVLGYPETFPAHVATLLRMGYVPRLGSLEIGPPEGAPAADPPAEAMALLRVLRACPSGGPGWTRSEIADALGVSGRGPAFARRFATLRQLGAIVESRPNRGPARYVLAPGVPDVLLA